MDPKNTPVGVIKRDILPDSAAPDTFFGAAFRPRLMI